MLNVVIIKFSLYTHIYYVLANDLYIFCVRIDFNVSRNLNFSAKAKLNLKIKKQVYCIQGVA